MELTSVFYLFQEQFKFCHDVVLEFLKQYDAYSNFQWLMEENCQYAIM